MKKKLSVHADIIPFYRKESPVLMEVESPFCEEGVGSI